MRQRYQVCPGVTRLSRLEAGQGPAQGLFAEAHTGLNRPAIDVGYPNCLGGDNNSSRRVERWQPGEPDGFWRFILLQMCLGTEDIAGQVRSVLVT